MRGRLQCYIWMGLVWMDGMDIIGHMSFKSTFSANGYHYHPHCSSGITGHYHHAYHQKDIQILGRKKSSINHHHHYRSSLFSQAKEEKILRCHNYFPRIFSKISSIFSQKIFLNIIIIFPGNGGKISKMSTLFSQKNF